MKNFMGKCEFCGTEIGVMAETQAEANKLAAGKCDCAASRIAEKKKCLKENLEHLIGSGAPELDFTPVERAVHDMIETAGCMVIEGQIQQAVFKVDGTIISITAAGEKVKIKRKRTHEESEEIK